MFYYFRIAGISVLVFFLAGCAARPVVSPPEEITPKAKKGQGVYHKVLKGDTLWRISKTYGVDLEDILASNRISDAERIKVGQVLFIPSSKTVSETVPSAFPHEDFIWPVKGKVISYFGQKKGNLVSKGIDIQAKERALVLASHSGKVTFIDEKVKGYGKTIILDHGDGFQTVYAHNSEILVDIGEKVRRSSPIAKVGSTGRVRIPYLHFEIRKKHKPQNPLHFLP